MRHADLRREATAVIAKQASAPCMDTVLCGTWCGCVDVRVCGRVGVCLVVGWAIR